MQRKHEFSVLSIQPDRASVCAPATRRSGAQRRLASLLPAVLVLALVAPTLVTANDDQESADGKPVPTRVDVIGKATINWHLTPQQPSAGTTALIERYRTVTAAHLTGDEPPQTEEPEPAMNRNGILVHKIPAELMSTMFFHPEGGTYCSDGTVPSPYAATLGERQGD